MLFIDHVKNLKQTVSMTFYTPSTGNNLRVVAHQNKGLLNIMTMQSWWKCVMLYWYSVHPVLPVQIIRVVALYHELVEICHVILVSSITVLLLYLHVQGI